MKWMRAKISLTNRISYIARSHKNSRELQFKQEIAAIEDAERELQLQLRNNIEIRENYNTDHRENNEWENLRDGLGENGTTRMLGKSWTSRNAL